MHLHSRIIQHRNKAHPLACISCHAISDAGYTDVLHADLFAQPLQKSVVLLSITRASCRGAGAFQRVDSHGPQLLQLLLDLGLADSRDTSIKAAMLQLVKQLLMPQTFQQLLADSTLASCRHDKTDGSDLGTAAYVQAGSSTSGSCSGGCQAADGCSAGMPEGQHSGTKDGPHDEGAATAKGLFRQLLEQLLDSGSSSSGNAEAVGGHASEAVDVSNEQEWLTTALQQLRMV